MSENKIFDIQLSTSSKDEIIDITREVEHAVSRSDVSNGLCYVFVAHTTAAVTINENADPDVKDDILMGLNDIVNRSLPYRHAEGNSSSHIKTSLIGASETVFIENKSLVLGTWQGIYFCEFDGPRSRKVYVKVVEG